MELGPYTPVSNALAQEVGLVCAAVYGEVWRQCQKDDKSCWASLDTMGKNIGVDRATVMRAIKKLCEIGYLVDTTPGRRNATHTYILGKSVAECNSLKDESVAERNTIHPTVAHRNNGNGKSVAECNSLSQTVAESHLKKEEYINSVTNKERESHMRDKPGPLALSLANVCLINLDTITNGTKKKYFDALNILVDIKASAEQVKGFGEWWKNNWRGKNGSPPLPNQVCDLWGEFQAGYQPKKVSISAK